MDKAEKELFVQAVYDIVKSVPYGRATSYGAIAGAIGAPNLSRMVGKIMGQCDSAVTGIPAHRVVNSQGVLSGRAAFGFQGEMRRLLEAEGIIVFNNRIKNWKTVSWDPLNEIDI